MVPRFQDRLEHVGLGLWHLLQQYKTLLIVLFIVFLVLWLISEIVDVILDAKAEVDKRPREDMAWCHKHGPIRKKHMLKLFPHMKKQDGTDFEFCPLCYKETVYDDVDLRAAREARNGKNTVPDA